MKKYSNTIEKQVKKLAIRFWAGIFVVFILIVSGILMFSSLYYKNMALALSGDYGKASGDVIDAAAWNSIGSDFVDKAGDTMTGNLDVTGNIGATGNVVAAGSLCIGTDCRSGWPTSTSPQGAWCGLTGSGSGSPKLCEGLNPETGCPVGYTQTTIYVTPGTHCTGLYGCTTHYTCIKD